MKAPERQRRHSTLPVECDCRYLRRHMAHLGHDSLFGQAFFSHRRNRRMSKIMKAAFNASSAQPSGLPTVTDGQLACIWTLSEVIKHSPGGVGGAIQVVVLTKEKSKWKAYELTKPDLDTHLQAPAVMEAQMPLQLKITPTTETPASPDQAIPRPTEPSKPRN